MRENLKLSQKKFLGIKKMMLIVKILLGIFLGLALLFTGIYLLLPWIFKVFVSPLFNASYKYKPRDFKKDIKEKPIQEQINKPTLNITRDEGIFEISFGKGRNLVKGGIIIHHNGFIYSNIKNISRKTRLLKKNVFTEQESEDKLGKFEETIIEYFLEDNAIKIIGHIKKYIDKNYIIFELKFPDGLENTATGKYKQLLSGFPSFKNNSPNKKVFTYRHAIFCPPSRKIKTTSAPVLLYDEDLNCVIISPLNKFLNAAISEEKNGRINCGIQGEINSIPKNYSVKFILYFSQGINKPMEELGDILLKYHKSSRKSLYSDIVSSYLGFWTDNGAYYYYKTEKGKNYEDTLVTIKDYFEEHNIPIRYYNFDSWWYLKHTNKFFTTIFRPIVRLMGGGFFGNTLKWEADPEGFSTDLKTFYEEHFQKPITAHNRRWDSRSPYLEDYNFITYKNHACPLEKDFWNWLMRHAKESGIVVYEQDWMKNQIDSVPQLREDITTMEKWLNSMATAAKENGVKIFYCMQTPAILLYSIKHPNITITRCSGDYNHRWPPTYRYVHSTQSNILIHAVGLNSHPDVFRSRSMEDSLIRPFGEKRPVFKCLYQNLNAGLVAPGDKKEHVNWSLLNKTCRDDGLLFKPDKPLTANDLMFRKHRKYYICDTYIKREGNYWRFVFITNIWPRRVKETFITAQELGFERDAYILYNYFEDKILKITNTQKIQIGNLKKYGYKYYIFNPILSNGLALIGCTDKFIPCSKKQFTKIRSDQKAIELSIEDLKGKTDKILLYSEKKPLSIAVKGGFELKEGNEKNNWNYNEDSKRVIISLFFKESTSKTLIIKTD
jgi:hypothetical protein